MSEKTQQPTTLLTGAEEGEGSKIARQLAEKEDTVVGAAATSSKPAQANTALDPGMAVVRRNTEEVQGKGNWQVFEELFAEDFIDHTPQPGGFKADKESVKNLYKMLRSAFPDFHAEIHWQTTDGDRVTTYKTYHGTHKGPIFGLAPTGRTVHFESVDVMRVRKGQITDHWGVGNLLSLMQQLGGIPEIPKN